MSVSLKDLKNHKSCTVCKCVKHFREFYPQHDCRGGVTADCIACRSEKARVRRTEAGFDEHREYLLLRYGHGDRVEVQELCSKGLSIKDIDSY